MRYARILFAAICLSLGSSPILAQSASSSAYALDLDQTVSAVGVADVNVSVGPLAQSAGNAPPPYNNSYSVASVDQELALTTGLGGVSENIQTGLLTTNASGTATGAEATSTVHNLSLGLGTDLFISSLFGLSATTIQSHSQANSVGGLDASGTTLIEGLTLTGSIFDGLTFDGSLFVNPAPNTILFSAGGLSIILNEQIFSGNGTTGLGIETNAIHIAFNSFPVGTGLKTGDIILGHTEAFATVTQAPAVPEPSTWAMMLLGFGAVGGALRRSKALRPAPLLA